MRKIAIRQEIIANTDFFVKKTQKAYKVYHIIIRIPK